MINTIKKLNEEINFNINLTRYCFMDCSHCFIERDVRKNKNHFDKEQLDSTLLNIDKYIEKNSKTLKRVNVRLTGGEVLTVPFEILKYALDRLYSFKNEKIFFDIKVTTSLLKKLDMNYVEILKKTRAVFTSYDLEVGRFNKNGLKVWEDNIKLLQDNGIEVIVNITVGKNILNKIDILTDMLVKNNIKDCHLGYFVPHNPRSIKLLPLFEETSNFMIDFHKRMKSINPEVIVSPIEAMKTSVLNNTFNDSFICEKANSFNINTDGNTFLCASEGGLNKDKDFKLFNIFTDNILDVYKNKEFREQKIKATMPLKECITCEFVSNCLSACRILHPYIKDNKNECPGFKKVWDYSKTLKI